ncbi:MAG: glycosyltransferase [bacterium]|nr:glycosyltransferase [bacterium]
MRIVFIGDGGSVHNRYMLTWFARRGHEVLFLTDTLDPEMPCETRCVVPRRGGGPWRHALAAYRVRCILQEWRPDVVHAHNVTGYGYWGAFCGFSPLVMTAWGSDLNVLAQDSALVRLLARSALRRSRLVTADALALCETAQAIAHQKLDVRLLQWGVDLAEFDQHIQTSLFPAGWEDLFVFISTRRLREVYNIDIILHAFAQVVRSIPEARLLVVGQDVLREDLQKLSRDLTIADRVCFTGWVERRDMVDLLRQAQVFISVPSTDSTALSLLEAFAARKPVIVTDLPANREWIEPGRNGILVPPRNEEALAAAMVSLANNRDGATQWGTYNRTVVEQRGNQDSEMRKLEAWYYEILT